jgi:hypothetical protein
VSPNPYLYILSNSFSKKRISFTLNTSKCNPIQEISIRDGQDNPILDGKKVDNTSSFNFEIDMTNSVVKRVQVITDSGGCQISDDPRNLFFEIKDFKMESS